MAGEGQILRDAREKLGWTLAKAEEETKIRVRYLEALEKENYKILPGTAYAKGFLRTYSKHLGLNPEEILSLFKASESTAETSKIDPLLSPVQQRPIWLRPAVAIIMGLFALGIVIGIAKLSSFGEKSSTAKYSPPPLPSAPKVEQPKEPINNAQLPKEQSQPNSSNVVAAPFDELRAEIVFTQPCWVVVNVDGQKVLEGTFAAGTTKELKASNSIEFVTIGNAGGISVTLNGKTLPNWGASGEVVRNKVLTKETLHNL